MRDSALKHALYTNFEAAVSEVGEELMRDSALKHDRRLELGNSGLQVGEELMRDSALKLAQCSLAMMMAMASEKSSCATAL